MSGIKSDLEDLEGHQKTAHEFRAEQDTVITAVRAGFTKLVVVFVDVVGSMAYALHSCAMEPAFVDDTTLVYFVQPLSCMAI